MSQGTVSLGNLMLRRKQSLDPRKHPNELFALFSIPAFDVGHAQKVLGKDVGSSKQLLEPNDVLLSRIVPHIRRAWVVHDVPGTRLIGSGEWIVFRSKRVWPPYLRHFLVSDQFHRSFMQTVAGVGGSLLRARPIYVADIEVPLPSIEEQRRIAAILDKADELRAKRRAAFGLTRDLVEALYLELVAENSDAPLIEMSRLLADTEGAIRTGPFGSQLLHSEFVAEGIPVLGIDNAVNNEFRWAKPRFITAEKYRQLSRFTVRPRDLLVTIMGTCGRVAVVPEDVPTAINTKHLCCLTLDHKRVLPEFLHSAFIFDGELRQQLGATARGAVMPGLNMTLIKNARVRVPPLPVQERFVESRKKVAKLEAAMNASSTPLALLFDSLQSRAFRGDL